MRIVLTCSCLIIVYAVWGQNITSTTLLSDTLNETSGLALVQGRLITHNDKGGEPKLYELDTLNGQLLRTVIVENATNVDWEDLCTDADHLYIGDMGNNDGDRTDLADGGAAADSSAGDIRRWLFLVHGTTIRKTGRRC